MTKVSIDGDKEFIRVCSEAIDVVEESDEDRQFVESLLTLLVQRPRWFRWRHKRKSPQGQYEVPKCVSQLSEKQFAGAIIFRASLLARLNGAPFAQVSLDDCAFAAARENAFLSTRHASPAEKSVALGRGYWEYRKLRSCRHSRLSIVLDSLRMAMSLHRTHRYDSLKIVGSRAFIDHTHEALVLLRETGAWEVISHNIREIRERAGGGADIQLSTERTVVRIGQRCWRPPNSLKWYASILAHEAYHNHRHRNRFCDTLWLLAIQDEYECERYQRDVLRQLGASQDELAACDLALLFPGGSPADLDADLEYIADRVFASPSGE